MKAICFFDIKNNNNNLNEIQFKIIDLYFLSIIIIIIIDNDDLDFRINKY